jgi:putative endonuclease
MRALRRAWIVLAPLTFARLARPDDAELGLLGERIAARHLRRSGCAILARRRATAAVEVDLVAREGRRVVLVEVKSGRVGPVPLPRGAGAGLRERLALRWRPGWRLSRERLAALRSVARALERSPAGGGARIDLVEVFLAPDGTFRIEHHRGVDAPLERG